MYRKTVTVVAAAAVGVGLLTGCGKAREAGQPTGGVITPTAAGAKANESTTKEGTVVKAAPPVIHPNVILTVKCTDDDVVASSTADINGMSGKNHLPLTVWSAKPFAAMGADCAFRLTASAAGNASFVTAQPRLRGSAQQHGVQWAFSEAMSAQGLNNDSSSRVPLLLSKGQSAYVYAEVNGLPKPDSFNSAVVFTPNLKSPIKDYNRRVAEMNSLALNKLSGISYPKYTG